MPMVHGHHYQFVHLLAHNDGQSDRDGSRKYGSSFEAGNISVIQIFKCKALYYIIEL